MTLLQKTLLPALLASLLALLVAAPLFFSLSNKMEDTATLLQSVSGAVEVSRGLDIIVAQSVRQADIMSAAPMTTTLLLHEDETTRQADWQRVRDYLQMTVSAFDAIDVMNVLDAQGNVLCSSSPLTEDTFRGDRRYFLQAMEGTSSTEGPLTARATGRPVVVLASPVRLGDDQIIGVVSVSLDLDYLNTSLTGKLKLERPGDVYVLSASGQVILHPHRSLRLATHLFSAEDMDTMRSEQQGVTSRMGEDGQPRRVAYVVLPYPGWIVIYEETHSQRPRIPLMRNIGMGVAALPLLILLLLLVPPLYRLRQDMRAIADYASQTDVNAGQGRTADTTQDSSAPLPDEKLPTCAGDILAQAAPLLDESTNDATKNMDGHTALLRLLKRKDEAGKAGRAVLRLSCRLAEEYKRVDHLEKGADRLRHEMETLIQCVDELNGGVAFLRLDANCTILWASEGFYRLHEYPEGNSEKSDPLARTSFAREPLRMVDPRDLCLLEDLLTTATRKRTPINASYRILLRHGGMARLHAHARHLGEDGIYPVFMAVFLKNSPPKIFPDTSGVSDASGIQAVVPTNNDENGGQA